jgi:predicted NAD-dependent protein-ADP-ribosyltransferase YbiA (DUF1768 family)
LSVAHALAAAKTSDPVERRRIIKAPTGSEVTKLAATIADPEDWNERKLVLMERFTRDKFRRNQELRERLRATQDRELVNDLSNQGPSADSLFWGTIGKKGTNWLG